MRDGERILGEYDEGVLAQSTLSAEGVNFICAYDVVVCTLWGKGWVFQSTPPVREATAKIHKSFPEMLYKSYRKLRKFSNKDHKQGSYCGKES